MFRRFVFVAFAISAVLQTGCCGRVRAFFYRVTHCADCCPSYGGVGYRGPVVGPMVGGPIGAAPCCSSPAMAAPVYAAPVSYGAPPMAAPVFSGMPQAMPGANVYPTPSAPMPEKK